MRLSTVLLAVGFIVLIAHTCVATAESHILEEEPMYKQGKEVESREEVDQDESLETADKEEPKKEQLLEEGQMSAEEGRKDNREEAESVKKKEDDEEEKTDSENKEQFEDAEKEVHDISASGETVKQRKSKKCEKTNQIELDIEGGLKACKYTGKNMNKIQISSGKIEVKDRKTGEEWKLNIDGERCAKKIGSDQLESQEKNNEHVQVGIKETENEEIVTEKTSKDVEVSEEVLRTSHVEGVEGGVVETEQMTTVKASGVSEATELTSEEASSEASSEEEKVVEEREVEEYMDHKQSEGYPESMSKKYRKELEEKLKAKYGAKWEVYYWIILVRDVDVHYSGSMSESERVELRKKYEKKYGVSWRIYYWRYVSQSIESKLDGSKIEELKKKYGKVWRLHYGGYVHWFGFKHAHHRDWFKDLTGKDFSDVLGEGFVLSTEVFVTADSDTYQKQVAFAESEEVKVAEERSVEYYMDHVGAGKSGVKYADCMSKKWRDNLAKNLKAKYGLRWEIPYWIQMTANIDRRYRGKMSLADRAKLRWSLIVKYGKGWRKYYWRVLAQDMELYLDGELINRLMVQYKNLWRLHYGPYSQWFVQSGVGARLGA